MSADRTVPPPTSLKPGRPRPGPVAYPPVPIPPPPGSATNRRAPLRVRRRCALQSSIPQRSDQRLVPTPTDAGQAGPPIAKPLHVRRLAACQKIGTPSDDGRDSGSGCHFAETVMSCGGQERPGRRLVDAKLPRDVGLREDSR